jgi:hypothetical protein
MTNNEWKEDFKSFVDELQMPRDDYKGIMAYIDECPVNDTNGWISVKDRLPEDIKPVLVWESQGFAYVDNYLNGDWSIGSANGAIITHWMPLPEPPKGDYNG